MQDKQPLKEVVAVPTWAIQYLEYGVEDNLTEEDLALIKEWQKSWRYLWVVTDEEGGGNEHFTWYPPFGKACDVIDCECEYIGEQDNA